MQRSYSCHMVLNSIRWWSLTSICTPITYGVLPGWLLEYWLWPMRQGHTDWDGITGYSNDSERAGAIGAIHGCLSSGVFSFNY